MKIVIAGGTGFIGKHLTQHLLTNKHEVTILGRSVNKIKNCFNDKVIALSWEQLTPDILSDQQLIINLTGATIGEKRWSAKRKQEILTSRLKATSILAALCAELKEQSPTLFNTSAIGVYGLQKSQANTLPPAFDETTKINFSEAPDFLSEVGRKWEQACQPAIDANVRVVKMRFGVVIDKSGGAFKQLALPFYFGLGGPIGSGQQPFSWVSLTDLIRAIDFLIEHKEISGPVNIVSPGCVTQKELATAIGTALHRPSFIPMPGFILKFIYGQMAEELILKGQHVKPNKLIAAGFKFKHETLLSVLSEK